MQTLSEHRRQVGQTSMFLLAYIKAHSLPVYL